MTLLYCIFSCLQIYILMSIGYISEIKKILSAKSSFQITNIILNLIIPLYFIIQLSKVVDMEIMKTFWILITNTLSSFILGYILSIIFHKILKMDIRIKQSFAAMNMIPALGGFPIVIAKGFCYPSGPIENDRRCNDFLGIVMLTLLIFNISVYIVAYALFVYDKNINSEIEGMMPFSWHHVIHTFYKKNYTVLFLFKKFFFNNHIQWKSAFEDFENNNYIPNNYNVYDNISYYEKCFKVIDDNLNLDLKDEYEKRKEKILLDLNSTPQKLPFIRSVKVNDEIYEFLKKNFRKENDELISINDLYKFKPEKTKIEITFILNKIITPPIVSLLIGIIMVISKTRLIIFNSNNIYWNNIIDGLNIIINNYTPLMIGLMGSLCYNANKDNTYIIASKEHVIVILLIKFLILPFLGILYIYIWKEFYGGIVKESVAYRLIMFSNWCLPSPANMTLLVNIVHYFGDEFGYLIVITTLFCIIGLTFLHLIYFVLVGLN